MPALTRPQRLAVGGLGLALWVPGLRLRRNPDGQGLAARFADLASGGAFRADWD